ncbi:MAG TPA: transposase [Candidatus Nitrosotalea sp.]|nr:transposase [Nitrososphaerota archaeon]HKU32477.1 transposase [Candidatus Nitrosotalea sp.]
MFFKKSIFFGNIVKVTKCAWQYHDKNDDLGPVFDYYRYCANEAIRIGIEKKITSKFKLYYQLYHKLRLDSQFHCKHVYGALECAASRLKIYKKTLKKKPNAKRPYISKNHLILDNQSYKIEKNIVRIPTESGKYVFIKLTNYVYKKIMDTKLGNITITDDKIIISYSRDIKEQNPTNSVGIDRNLENVTTYNSQGNCIVYDLAKAQRIVTSYCRIKSKFRRNDSRIRKKIFQKYGKLQKNRAHSILHYTSKKIVSENSGIIMENLKGIRKLYKKGNWQGRKHRQKMNSWSFYELQRQIEYKARWLGLPVEYVKANGTSTKCAICGSRLVPEEHRKMFCSICKSGVDRDVNAAHNILLRGTRVVPNGIAGEAVMAELDSKEQVICRVDAVKSCDGINLPIT